MIFSSLSFAFSARFLPKLKLGLGNCAVLGFLASGLGTQLAFAAESLSVSAQSTKGVSLILSLPLKEIAKNIKTGGLVCSTGGTAVSVSAASLWIEHGHGLMHGGHAGPPVTTRMLDSSCFQINDIVFPNAGEWEVKVTLANSDSAVFTVSVKENLASPVFTAQGNRGSSGTFTFNGKNPSSKIKSGSLCVNEKSDLTSAELWMPDMGHGSSPTSLVKRDLLCTDVNQMEFFMDGKWEIRTQLASGETLDFDVNIKE